MNQVFSPPGKMKMEACQRSTILLSLALIAAAFATRSAGTTDTWEEDPTFVELQPCIDTRDGTAEAQTSYGGTPCQQGMSHQQKLCLLE